MKRANWHARVRAGAIIAAGTAGSMIMLSAVAPAGATDGPNSGKVALPQGITAASLDGTRISAAPAATKETISFVLKMQNPGALKFNVQNGMPHGFLSVRTFASRYGQPHANIVALERYLSRFGIKSTAYADGLDISTTGTAAQYGKALSVRQSLYRLSAVRARGNRAGRPAMVVPGTTDKPLLPASLAKLTWAQVAADIRDPNSAVAKGVDGAANSITAAICKITTNAPAAVCNSPAAKAGAGAL